MFFFRTANVETRNKACFCARNVLDGMRFADFHGEWPYQLWGIGVRGTTVLSDGTKASFPLAKTGERQFVPLGISSFPALVEWEAFGREARN